MYKKRTTDHSYFTTLLKLLLAPTKMSHIGQNIAHEKTMTFGKSHEIDEANSQSFQIEGKCVLDTFVLVKRSEVTQM